MNELVHRRKLIVFPQNRVWRTYPGGRVLDRLAGKGRPEDTHFPEDWIGSVTSARNAGREDVVEGVSEIQLGKDRLSFAQLLEQDAVFFLGRDHVRAFGPKPQLLVKLLDAAVRLHFQCHPTAEFAKARLNEPSGKAEAYHILSIREEVRDPCVYIGFQRPPSREQLRDWILEQNLSAIEDCFDPLPVEPGDTLFIPGGYPHAIGPGILMVEVMEPSDLAIRFEFEKAGYVLPEEARFMGRDIDFALEVFDFTPVDEELRRQNVLFPARKLFTYPGGGGELYHLLGEEATPCMRLRKTFLHGEIEKVEKEPYFGIVTEGEVLLSNGDEERRLPTFSKFFHPAEANPYHLRPVGAKAAVLECYPPKPPAQGA